MLLQRERERERERERAEIIDKFYQFIKNSQDFSYEYEGKIIWAEMTKTPCFVWNNDGAFINQTCYFIPNANKYLLSLLNSKVVYFYIKNLASSLGEGAYRWIKQYIELLPIPKISSQNQNTIDKIIVLTQKILSTKQKNAQADTIEEENKIDTLIYELYGLNQTEIQIIESSLS
ncbi:TaqI-like C-terminal specificity domain-containing protein [Helicobacter sp. 13S00477-4]|uniref:TaqI-like C-terminal specificity domain-containing protein n=1 Tax=Helicobacter sp. 13S00477-4 TaxID=1905759 RepID=UPI000BDBF3BE|nr:TaqI-like C-terminal specificity domain-containing protein [Helicobacter sp. 13S00477-4]PAF52237.1 hypothetical protein BKH44_03810 [Helicobacter sp. 13S00477-4]